MTSWAQDRRLELVFDKTLDTVHQRMQKVSAGLGYRINPDREGNRWLKSVNGENKDFYQLVPQEGAMKGVLSTDAAEAPSEPPAPPVVENGRFTGFCFGDDLQGDDK